MKNLIFAILCFISHGVLSQRIGEIVIFYPQNPQFNRFQGVCPAIVTGFHADPDSLDLHAFLINYTQSSPDIVRAANYSDAISGGERWSTVAQAVAWGIDLKQYQQVLSPQPPPNNTNYADWFYDIVGNAETFWNDSIGGTGIGRLMTKYAAQQAIDDLESDMSSSVSGKLNLSDTASMLSHYRKKSVKIHYDTDVDNKPSTFAPSPHNHAYTDIVGAPWLTSYTETDPNVPAYSKTLTAFSVIKTSTDALYSVLAHNHTFASLTSKPTTLSGYGITDAYPLSGNPSGFLTGITSGNVTTALGFTPYNATNPSGYITGINSSAVITALGFTPLSAEVDGSTSNEIELPSQTGNAGRTLRTNGTVVSWGKRQEPYSGTTDGSGLYTVTFGTAYSATPNIQANVVGGSTEQMSRIVSVSTTGFQIHVFQRATVLSLALSTATTSVSGATVHVLITEQ